MFWNRYFYPFVIILLIVTGLHWIGSIYDLYDGVWWFDIVMHFLGGLWVSSLALWFVNTRYGIKLQNSASTKNLLLFVLLVGILWEIHELILGFEQISRAGYYFDTAKDLLMDILGGITGIRFLKK